MLCAQLQNLHDRAPPRGAAVATLSVLLESCRTSSPHQLTLRPPSLALAVTASGSNQHPTYSSSAAAAAKSNGCTTYTVAIVRSDKSTNTNSTNELCPPVSNGLTRISITDEYATAASPAATDFEAPLKSMPIDSDKNASVDLNSKTIESNFFNLQLQCMCTCNVGGGGGGGGVVETDIVMDATTNERMTTGECEKCLHCSSSVAKPNSHLGGEAQCDSNSNTKLSECAQCDGSFNSLTAQQQDHHKNVETISCQSNIVRDIEDAGNDLNNSRSSGVINVISSSGGGTFDKSNDSYRRIGVSVTESLGNDVPPTPSPTISNISSENIDENRKIPLQDISGVEDVNDDNDDDDVKPSELIADEGQSIDETVMSSTMVVVPNSSNTSAASTITSSEEASCSSSGTSVTAAAATAAPAKRSKDAKLVLDLNDRSKYTKEVSV